MKRIYYWKNKNNWLSTIVMIVALSMVSAFSSAQTVLSWNGSVDTDATNPLNWTPNESIIGNELQVDSAHKYTNSPILSLTGDNAISRILVATTGVFTVADAGNFLDINSGSTTYLDGTIVVQAGAISWRKNLYLENPASKLVIEGGSLETRDNFPMGRSDGASGGQVEIKGTGLLYCRKAPIRFASDSLQSVITITGDATMEVNGDWVAGAEALIARNQITSDDSFDPFAVYDTDRARTVIDLRSKDALFMTSTATIQVLVDEVLPDVTVVNNRGFQNLVSKEWKYATASGGPYMSFDPAQTGDVLTGVSFAAAGTYYVVLEGDTGSGTIMSDEVQVSVTSPMVQLDPEAEQTIRVGWVGGMITATTLEPATSLEWKYATTSGGPFSSFDPAVTVAEYIPDFDAEGIYYVICEAVVNSVTYSSPEVTIKMVARNAPGQSINWTGTYSTDASDPRNWDPIMVPWFNTLGVGVEFVDNPPVIATTGNDTVAFFALADSAEIVINKPESDTLVISGDGWQVGRIVIESGIVNNRSYGRLDNKNAGVIIKGNSQFLATGGGLIIGNATASNSGGKVIIQDNGYMLVTSESDGIWRWTNDTVENYIMISDNGKLEIAGDWTSEIATRIARLQIKAPEGFEIEYMYDAGENKTIVTAKSQVAFDITPLDAQYVGVGMPIDALSTINDETITSREWKYSATSGTDYMSFDPAETGTTLTASFDAAGTYYVICEGSDGSETYMSDEAIIYVVSVDVTPPETQEILELEEGALLTVVESMTPDSREWKYTETSGSGYQSFAIPQTDATYRPFFQTASTYYVICESVYNGKGIMSNEVEIIVSVDNTGINDLESAVYVYPNPTSGKFFINMEASSYTLKVYDLTGKTVLNREFNNVSGPQEISLTTKGVHVLQVIQEDNVSTTKVVVK